MFSSSETFMKTCVLPRKPNVRSLVVSFLYVVLSVPDTKSLKAALINETH